MGWVLYDDSCGFCRRWIPGWAGVLRRRGFEIATLQSEWVVKRLALSPQERMNDLWLLLADGSKLRGADTYRYLMRRIWWAYPLYLFSVTPLLRRAFDRGYRLFADNRYRVSRACRLSGASSAPASPARVLALSEADSLSRSIDER